jgi:YggT family protein
MFSDLNLGWLERQEILLSTLGNAITILTTALSIIIIADVILSYILDPFHPVRRFLDGIVQPLLAPIQRILPPVGGLDFSPVVLLILLDLVSRVIRGFLP